MHFYFSVPHISRKSRKKVGHAERCTAETEYSVRVEPPPFFLSNIY